MVENDVQLIRRILSGDDEAFSTLVQKHQRGVHALVWRKVSDFHYAEEITQDTFLQAYKKLSTLKNPNQFAGWLYVIANRLCINWLQRHKPAMQSLEDTPVAEIEESSYIHHASEQREAEGIEHRHELAQKLLSKLPESERTVMTLHYLGEMTAKEISKFLGVSVNTITNRLWRARKRLREDQELLVQEVLGGVPFPTNLTENIMRQVVDLKPTPPPVTKPLLPWGAFGVATLLVVFLLGATDQYLVRFQKPYSFEAVAEPTVEIVDTFIVLDVDSKPDVRNQIGRAASTDKIAGRDYRLLIRLQYPMPRGILSGFLQRNGPEKGHANSPILLFYLGCGWKNIRNRGPDATRKGPIWGTGTFKSRNVRPGNRYMGTKDGYADTSRCCIYLGCGWENIRHRWRPSREN